MQTLEIKIEAFGAIERLLPKGLTFEFAEDRVVADVLTHIVALYPEATKAMEKCACAIGEDIVTRQRLQQYKKTSSFQFAAKNQRYIGFQHQWQNEFIRCA